jgi:late competence protein required for DNA uptake (superfamily II DNA/RNA helicase)
MAWLCLKDNALSGSQMCIVTGPRIDLAIALIVRMKRLFTAGKGLITSFDTKETVIELNGVKIEAFPSHHLDAMRGLPNVSFILLDEADFFPVGQQQDARDVSERYIAKSNPYIVMVSTPNAPDGLFERIEKESEDTCIYKRLFLDYTCGIGKIYTQEEIEKAKASPSFERQDLIYQF